jgi:hypothetical protein
MTMTIFRDLSRALLLAVLTLTVGLAACLGESPEERLRTALGDDRDGDEEHRPGQPCLVCHSADYHPGDAVFVLAGTIYQRVTDPDDQGVAGAEVNFIDSDGFQFAAITNSVGNFMVEVDPALSEPRQLERGRLRIPRAPTFPLTVAVIKDGIDRSMESSIWREGSCAGCHRSAVAGADHVEKVWHAAVIP